MRKTVVFVCMLVGLAPLTTSVALAAEDDFGGPEITFNTPAVGVKFSHKSHVGDIGLECDACHEAVFAMEVGAAEKGGNFTMASFTKGLYCGACHDGKTAFSAATDCTSCHASGGEIIYTQPVQGVLFSHAAHVDKMGLECDGCHSGLFAMKALAAQKSTDFTMETLYQGGYCGACHDGSTAFASNTRCADCHVGVKGLKRATGESGGKKAAH
jgi:c(7)-type cytochrome triheme protein